jgi:DNA repair photolyase
MEEKKVRRYLVSLTEEMFDFVTDYAKPNTMPIATTILFMLTDLKRRIEAEKSDNQEIKLLLEKISKNMEVKMEMEKATSSAIEYLKNNPTAERVVFGYISDTENVLHEPIEMTDEELHKLEKRVVNIRAFTRSRLEELGELQRNNSAM